MDVSPSICPHHHVNGGREGQEGHVVEGESPPHMLPSGVACPPPIPPALPERVKAAPTAPALVQGRRGSTHHSQP